MICGGGNTLERYVEREDMENSLMKMLTRKVESGEKVDFSKGKWCGPIPLSHKLSRVYANSECKSLTRWMRQVHG